MKLYFLIDKQGQVIKEAYFKDKKTAIQSLPDEHKHCRVVDENERLTEKYLPRIKAAKPTLRKSGIVMDMENAVFIRNGHTGEFYTYIPFTHYGVKFCFRENASEEWVEKVV